MIRCASLRAASIWRCCSARACAAASRSRFAPPIASSSAFSRASTAAVIFGKTSLPRMTSSMTKVTRVQSIRPPLGERRSPDCPDSSGATCAVWKSAKMRLCMDSFSFGRSFAVSLPLLPPGSRARHANASRDRAGRELELELALNQERDDDRKQRDTFDERREDDRAGLNAPGHLRLTSHAVHRLAGQTSDTDTRPDCGETSAETGAEQPPSARGLAGERCCGLKQRKDREHCVSPFNNRRMSYSRPLDRRPSAGLSPQRTSPARSAGYVREVEHSPRQCAPSRISPMKTLDRSMKMNACRNATNSSSNEMPSAIAIGSGTRIHVAKVKMRLISASSTTCPEIMLAKSRIASANGLVSFPMISIGVRIGEMKIFMPSDMSCGQNTMVLTYARPCALMPAPSITKKVTIASVAVTEIFPVAVAP